MKNTWFFNSLKAVICGLLLFIGGVKAAEVNDAANIALQKAMMAERSGVYTPYAMPSNPGMVQGYRGWRPYAMPETPEMVQGYKQPAGWSITPYTNYAVQKAKEFGSAAFNQETYKKAGRAIYQGAGSAYDSASKWVQANPKLSISILLGVAIVGGTVAGYYYSTVPHMSSQEKMIAQAYIALQNQLLLTVDDLVQFKEIKQAIANLNVNTSKKTGVTNIREKLDRILADAEKSFMAEFDRVLLKSERKVKLSAEYIAVKKDIKDCLNTYIQNANGNTKDLTECVAKITERLQKAIDALDVVLTQTKVSLGGASKGDKFVTEPGIVQ